MMVSVAVNLQIPMVLMLIADIWLSCPDHKFYLENKYAKMKERNGNNWRT